MATSKNLTIKDIQHIGKLANVALSEAEIEKFQEQLSETISYVENLSELDTEKVQPTSHSTAVSNVYFKDGTENKRNLTPEEALFNTKSDTKKYFKVSRIMEE